MPARAEHDAKRHFLSVPGYEILEEVGRGAMGIVYRARQLSLDRVVALKVLNPRLANDAHYTGRFLRETRLAGRITHPNVIAVYDAGHDKSVWYLAMEFVEGRTLADRIREEGHLEESEAIHVAEQIASALVQAHALGILHRDVKPSNIILSRSGLAKLADLGLAKRVAGGDPALTHSGVVVGTPAYMAPEQCRGAERADGRVDIYSLGATLYHMIAGHPPYVGDNDLQVIHMQLEAPLPRLAGQNPSVSRRTCSVVERMLAKDPSQRFGSSMEVVQALRDLTAPRPAMMQRQGRRRKWLLASVAAAAFVAIVFWAATKEAGNEESLPAASERGQGVPHPSSSAQGEELREGVNLDEKAAKALRKAAESAESGDVLGALAAFARVTSDYPNTRGAAEAAKAENALRRRAVRLARARADALAREDKWAEAVRELEGGLKFDPDDEKTAEALKQARFGLLRHQGDALLRRGEVAAACERFSDALAIQHDAALAEEVAALKGARTRSELRRLLRRMAVEPESWTWEQRDQEFLKKNTEQVWRVVDRPDEHGVERPHVVPQLLAGLYSSEQKRALDRLVDLWLANTEKEGVSAERAILSLKAGPVSELTLRAMREDEAKRKRLVQLMGRMGPDALAELSRVARSSKPRRSRIAFAALVRAGAPAVPTLVGLLGDRSDPVREGASDALAGIGPAAVPKLVEASWRRRHEGGEAAIGCLARIGPAGLPELLKSMAGLSKETSAHVGRAVKMMGQEALPGLTNLLDDPDEAVRAQAVLLLKGFGKPVVKPLVGVWRARVQRGAEASAGQTAALVSLGELVVPAMMDAFQSRDTRMRAAAEEVLARVGLPAIPSLLKMAVWNGELRERLRATRALGRIGPDAVPALLGLSLSTNRIVQREALGRIIAMKEKAAPKLVEALGRRHPGVQLAAIRLLAHLGVRDAVPHILGRLRDKSKDVSEAAISAIGVLGGTSNVPALGERLSDKGWRIRLSVVRAVGKLQGPHAGKVLVRALGDRSSKVDEAAREALLRLGEASLPSLQKVLSRKDEKVSQGAVEIASQIGGSGAVPVLVAALRGQRSKVRLAAARGLVKIADPNSVKPLVSALQDSDTKVRVAAADALGKIADAAALNDLIRALEKNRRDVRIAAAYALAEIGGWRAGSALRRASRQDGDETVRLAARVALTRLRR